MKVLGIETSCDETSIAIVDNKKNIISHILKSQIDLHKIYGGVVPEIAARAHVEIIDQLILQALKEANLNFTDIDGFCATCGPGLIGSVIVGMICAKTLASVHRKPFIAINHLEGHALTIRLSNADFNFPYLLLLVSGGHCQILLVNGLGNYKKLGETIDDALGESFDKVAQMLNLSYPGGPEIENLAKIGNARRFKFSKPLIDNKNEKHNFDFSFSGLKTAVRREIEKLKKDSAINNQNDIEITMQDKADICASFQKTVSDILINRLENVINFNNQKLPIEVLQTGFTSPIQKLVIAGGVASNRYIFSNIEIWAKKHDIKVFTPPLKLCTDNAAMIAWVGVEKLTAGKIDNLNFKPRARWDLA